MTGERVESEGFYEMLWDCDHCGTQGLLGNSQRHCPECGAPQNPDKRYFPSPEQQKRIEGHSYEGADRHCPACNAPMAAKANNCDKCGSPLDGSKEVRGVISAPAPTRKRRRIWPYIVGALVVIGVVIWFFFIRTRDAEVTVTAHRWERVVTVEQYGDYDESAWRDQVPADASVPVCHRRQRSTRKVQTGEECHTEKVDKKDGTFEQVRRCRPTYRDEPVDDDWCSFRVRRWKQVNSVRAAGSGIQPVWPAQLPAADSPATLGAMRSGARKETLILDFGGDSCDVNDATWKKYRDGQKVKVEVRARSGKVVCGSL
jgi:predicted nucleic acid-binding Zn ribbon protein